MRNLSVLLAMSCFTAMPLVATPTTDRSPPTQRAGTPTEDAAEQALIFLGSLDTERLFEKAYAERILQQIDIARTSDRYDGDVRTDLELFELIALWATDRAKDAISVADAAFARGATRPEFYSVAFALAAGGDVQKAIAYLERADKDLTTPQQRAIFKDRIDDPTISAVTRPLFRPRNQASLARLAEGLLKFNWPGDGQYELQDSQRMMALDGRLAKGDVAGARVLARQIASPAIALPLFVVKTYDRLIEDGDRVARMAALIEVEDKRSAQALKAKPNDLKLILTRAQFLRSTNRDSDALAVLLPHSSDMAAVEKGGSDAFWVVNEAAYALNTLGRGDEAIALMRRLIALGLNKHPDLISMAINSAGIMSVAGQHRQAATHAEDLFRRHPDKASKYGQMWMWAGAACGHASSGNIAAARPWLARLRAAPDDNRAALMNGLLCVNDLDGAAAQLIERLEGDEAGDMLVAIQDYTITTTESANERMLDERLQQVVVRPDVAAAIASKGRILKLPLSRTYWGMF